MEQMWLFPLYFQIMRMLFWNIAIYQKMVPKIWNIFHQDIIDKNVDNIIQKVVQITVKVYQEWNDL